MRTYRINVEKPCDADTVFLVRSVVVQFMQQKYRSSFPIRLDKKGRKLEVAVPDAYAQDDFSREFADYFYRKQQSKKSRIKLQVYSL